MRYTALHWAAVNGHVNIGRLLLESGADVEALNDRECASPALATQVAASVSAGLPDAKKLVLAH